MRRSTLIWSEAQFVGIRLRFERGYVAEFFNATIQYFTAKRATLDVFDNCWSLWYGISHLDQWQKRFQFKTHINVQFCVWPNFILFCRIVFLGFCINSLFGKTFEIHMQHEQSISSDQFGHAPRASVSGSQICYFTPRRTQRWKIPYTHRITWYRNRACFFLK